MTTLNEVRQLPDNFSDAPAERGGYTIAETVAAALCCRVDFPPESGICRTMADRAVDRPAYGGKFLYIKLIL